MYIYIYIMNKIWHLITIMGWYAIQPNKLIKTKLFIASLIDIYLICLWCWNNYLILWSLLNEHFWIVLFLSMYVLHSISFQAIFVQAFKIVVDSWKFIMLLLYIFWDDWPIFMISGSKEQQQQQLEYTLLKPDCYSWWISKMQSGHQDTFIIISRW